MVVRNKLIRITLMLLEVSAAVALVVWISKTYVATVVAQRPTLDGLELAIKLDPSDSTYHALLARRLEYDPTHVDTGLAIQHLRRATSLSPDDSQRWLDLGAALEFQGDTAEAEASLRRADFLAPNISGYQWTIGNFLLLHGNVDEAFRHFKIALAGGSRYSQSIFGRAWKAADDGGKILNLLIPNDLKTEFDYLSYLLSQKNYADAQSVWTRIMASGDAFAPRQATLYIDSLIAAHRPREAYQIWTDLRFKGIIKPTYEATSENLMVNGDFEEEPLNMGFDWRIADVDGAFAEPDESYYHSPSHALMIQFEGSQNLDYRHVYQYVRVASGQSYRLRGFLRTEGITTDCGVRLEVRDAYDPSALEKLSEDVTGSSTGWLPVTLDFTTGPKTELVIVAVARLQSQKFDNKIAGKVWADDLSLAALRK